VLLADKSPGDQLGLICEAQAWRLPLCEEPSSTRQFVTNYPQLELDPNKKVQVLFKVPKLQVPMSSSSSAQSSSRREILSPKFFLTF
jgi:hypothetical protein